MLKKDLGKIHKQIETFTFQNDDVNRTPEKASNQDKKKKRIQYKHSYAESLCKTVKVKFLKIFKKM